MTHWIKDETNQTLILFEDDEVKYVVDLIDGFITIKDKDEYKPLLTRIQQWWINSHKQNSQTDQPA